MNAFSRKIKYTIFSYIIDFFVNYTPFLNLKSSPPKLINYSGGGDFEAVGNMIVAELKDLTHLNKGTDVLEIGCGIARNSLALQRAFGDEIAYTGFDVVRFGISWSQKRFVKHKDHYRFYHANIFNSFYNPRGRIAPGEYVFPHSDSCFDLVFATSVFTHMQEKETYHFIAEAIRVLKPGGQLAFTAFLWDQAAQQAIEEGSASFSFKYHADGARIEDCSEPDLAVAHDRARLRTFLSQYSDREPRVLEGAWRGPGGYSFQDYVVFEKALP